MLKSLMMAASLAAMALPAHADTSPCDPPKPRVKKKIKKVPPPQRVEPTVPKIDCDCVGEKGEKGDTGYSEVVVIERHEVRIVREKAAIGLRLGVMGTVQAPHGDWAWGPALQLETPLSDRYTLGFAGGLALGASDGRESGYLLQLTVERRLGHRLGLSAGLHYTDIEGSEDNGEIDGSYLGASVGLVVRKGGLRLEVGPIIGGLRDDNESGTQLAIGAQGSAFYGFSW